MQPCFNKGPEIFFLDPLRLIVAVSPLKFQTRDSLIKVKALSKR